MKKMNLYLWLIALVGLFAACSQDDVAGPQNNESNRVSLTASLPADFATIGTRALPSAPNGYKLRCILEVWTQGDDPVLKHREEQAGLSGDNVQFDFTIDEGTYDCLFWADYIESGAALTDATISSLTFQHYPDKYYTTVNKGNTTGLLPGLKAIEIIGANYAFNTDARDAFFGSYELTKEAAAVENPPIPALKRPFAKLTIKEKNADNYAACTGLTATYWAPRKFNVLTGAVVSEASTQALCENKSSGEQELFSDYIFTDATSTFVQIKMTFTGDGKTFQDITIPAGIPLKRNYKTIASGTLITEVPVSTNDVKLTVTMNDTWNGSDVDDDLDTRIWNGTATAEPADYTSTPGPVDITSAAELAWLSSQNTSFEGYTFNLTTDINLNNHEWTPIGASGFKGTFDGKKHTVSNLKCTTSQHAGLFGDLNSATVKDVTVSGSVSYVTNDLGALGGIAGWVTNSTISGCTNKCTVTGMDGNNQAWVGGIAGNVVLSDGGISIFTNNTNTGIISTNNKSDSHAGGIIGRAVASKSGQSITLTQNTYSRGTPNDVCIGYCYTNNNGTILIDLSSATSGKPYPVPTSN